MMMRTAIAFACVLVTAAAHAAEPAGPPQIVVIGLGEVRSAPDVAIMTFSLRGEGATAEAAVRALVTSRAKVESVLPTDARAPTELRSGELQIDSARSADCKAEDYENELRLSEGPCAVRGHVATLSMTVRTKAVAQSGSILAEAARAGATEARLAQFTLANPQEARGLAVAAALADARAQAESIAAGSGGRLGRLRNVRDEQAQTGSSEEIIVTGQRRRTTVSGTRLQLPLSPQPVITTARLVVTFEIAPAVAR